MWGVFLAAGAAALALLLPGCVESERPPAKSAPQPLPGNKREQQPVGDSYVDVMTTAARTAKQGNNRFRISVLASHNCLPCQLDLEAVRELQSRRGDIDLVTYELDSIATAALGEVRPLMILQFGDCSSAAAISGAIVSEELASLLTVMEQGCRTGHSTLGFSRHVAPLEL